MKLSSQSQRIAGACTLKARIRYQARTKQFFLHGVELEEFAVAGLPAGIADRIRTAVTAAAQKDFSSLPVYTIRATNLKTMAAWILLKEVRVRDQEVHVTLGL